MQVATGHGAAERQRVAELATPTFKVRFGRSIADAMTLPILLPQDDRLTASAEPARDRRRDSFMSSPRTGRFFRIGYRWRAPRATPASKSTWRRGSTRARQRSKRTIHPASDPVRARQPVAASGTQDDRGAAPRASRGSPRYRSPRGFAGLRARHDRGAWAADPLASMPLSASAIRSRRGP